MSDNSDSLLCAAIVGIALAPSPVLADSFRCGVYLIREGMPAAEVGEKCGEPDSVESVSEPIMARRPNGSMFQIGVTPTEYWRYDRGPRRFPVRLTIRDGVAEEIDLLTRN